MAFGVSRDRVSIHTVRAVDARGKAAAGVQLGSLVTFRVLARTQYVSSFAILSYFAPLRPAQCLRACLRLPPFHICSAAPRPGSLCYNADTMASHLRVD